MKLKVSTFQENYALLLWLLFHFKILVPCSGRQLLILSHEDLIEELSHTLLIATLLKLCLAGLCLLGGLFGTLKEHS